MHRKPERPGWIVALMLVSGVVMACDGPMVDDITYVCDQWKGCGDGYWCDFDTKGPTVDGHETYICRADGEARSRQMEAPSPRRTPVLRRWVGQVMDRVRAGALHPEIRIKRFEKGP